MKAYRKQQEVVEPAKCDIGEELLKGVHLYMDFVGLILYPWMKLLGLEQESEEMDVFAETDTVNSRSIKKNRYV